MRVEEQGLLPIDIVERSAWRWQPPVRVGDLAILFRNVATLTESGVPVERAFAVSEALVAPTLASAISEIREELRRGLPVSEGLARRGDAFSSSIIGIVRAGERGSALAGAFSDAANQLEAEAELRGEIRSALAYPIVILLMGLATIGVLAGVVIPRFALLLSDLGADLPASTQFLLSGSAFVQRWGLLGIVLFGVGVPAAVHWVRSPRVRPAFHRGLLSLPVVGPLRHAFATARACRALGATLTNGLPLLQGLDAAADAAGDAEVAARIRRSRVEVAGGAPLTESLEQERAFTRAALQLVGVGEASSRLGPMTSRAGDVSALRAGRRLKTAITLLEPILIVGLGVLVAATAGALLQAVYSVRPG